MARAAVLAASRRDVERECRTADDAVQLHRSAVAALDAAVPFDAWCSMTVDPATVLPTGGYHDEGLPPQRIPRLLDIEHGTDDPNALRDLARADAPLATLAATTGGQLERSARFREVLEPSGIVHELRVALRVDGATWGAIVLMRAPDRPDFSDDEVAHVAALVEPLARGTRRALALTSVRVGDEPDTGLVLLRESAGDLGVLHMSDTARAWLDDVDDSRVAGSGIPLAVRGLAASAHHGGRCRVRTRSGRWLTLRAERTADGTVAVLVAPSRPPEVAALLAGAHGLTRRECEVVLLVARGLSTTEIAKVLWLSPHTVQDHLKKVFERLGVRSRGELTSRLFVDQYLPRTLDGDEPGWDGWFVDR